MQPKTLTKLNEVIDQDIRDNNKVLHKKHKSVKFHSTGKILTYSTPLSFQVSSSPPEAANNQFSSEDNEVT